jgi:hypothetical protein
VISLPSIYPGKRPSRHGDTAAETLTGRRLLRESFLPTVVVRVKPCSDAPQEEVGAIFLDLTAHLFAITRRDEVDRGVAGAALDSA